MGKPSDKRKSAKRLGKRERRRVKTHRRSEFLSFGNVLGGDKIYVKAGRKKMNRFYKWYVASHLSVVYYSESARE